MWQQSPQIHIKSPYNRVFSLRRPGLCSIFVLFTTCFIPCFGGCDNPSDRLQTIAASLPTAGRAGVTLTLRADFDAKRLTFEECLIRAEELLAAGDPNATGFAGAVLDLAAGLGGVLPDGAEFELFWRRIGQLAYRSALASWEAGRFDETDTLVLAGPFRWQRASYWQAYPNHDILVAATLGRHGRTGEAIGRLESRPLVTPEMQEAVTQLRELGRQQLRDRLREQIEAEQPDGG